MYAEGQYIRVRSLLWKVTGVRDLGRFYVLTLTGAEEYNRGLKIRLLSSSDTELPEVIEVNTLKLGRNMRRYSSWKTFMDAVTFMLHKPKNIFTSVPNSRIRIEDYQFVPLLKAMSVVPPRILIADDVGVGKTIEAGLLLQELLSRNMANRVLIVVPASLQEQWRDEMERRFYLDFTIFDSDTLKEILRDMVTGENPWERYNRIITSIDYVKRPEIRRQLLDVYWDVVIIDEAHYLSYVFRKTDRARFGEFISQRTDSLILLTATPHNGRDESFISLLKLLNPHITPKEFQKRSLVQKYFVRRLKMDIMSGYRPPSIETVGVSLDDESEKRIYNKVIEYTDKLWQQAKAVENNTAAFAMVILKKRLLSSFYSLKKSLLTRRMRFQEYLEERSDLKEEQFTLDIDKKRRYFEDISLTERQKENLERTILHTTLARDKSDLEVELKEIDAILKNLDELDIKDLDHVRRGDVKSRKLLELLKELGVQKGENKVIIFTEYRDTQDFLVKFLENNGYENRIVIIHGQLSKAERSKAEKDFLSDEKWIMVATDAASEGINFQEKCHIVINYELPWNPNRLLQRIGRVDRYGQRRDVIVKNLFLTDTYEGNILKLLVEKIENIMNRIGSAIDVLGLFDTEVIVNNLMDRDERNLATLEKFFMDWEKESLVKMSKFYDDITTSPQEGLTEVVKRLEKSFRHNRMLENFVKQAVIQNGGKYEETGGSTLRLFLPEIFADGDQTLNVTFDREYALANPEIEYITLSHPLIKKILWHYRKQLYSTDHENRISYITLPGEKDSVVYYFYVKYVDGSGRLAMEDVLPVRVGLDGREIPWDNSLLESKPLKENLPPEFLKAVSDKWDDLLSRAEDICRELAERRRAALSDEIEKRLQIHHEIVMNYYTEEISNLQRQVKRLEKNLVKQATLYLSHDVQSLSEEERRLKKDIERLKSRIYRLEMLKTEKLEELDEKKKVSIGERRILSALIIKGGSP